MTEPQQPDDRAIVPVEQALAQVTFDQEKLEVLHLMYPKMTQQDERLFVMTCNRTFLDPFARQVFAVWRYSAQEKREIMQVQVSIDGFRIQAERSRKYAGQVGPLWCGEDGVWVEAWIKPTPPAAAKVGVWRDGAREPIWGVATYQEYVQRVSEQSGGGPNAMWRKMPATMLAKCAESLALRRALPVELAGLYTEDEMGQSVIDHDPAPTTDVQAPPPPRPVPAPSAPRPATPAPAPAPSSSNAPTNAAPKQEPPAQQPAAKPGKLEPLGTGEKVTEKLDPDYVRFGEIREAGVGTGMTEVSLPSLPIRRAQLVNLSQSLLTAVNTRRTSEGLDAFVPSDPTAPPPIIDADPTDAPTTPTADPEEDRTPQELTGDDDGESPFEEGPATPEQRSMIALAAARKGLESITLDEMTASIGDILSDGALARSDVMLVMQEINRHPDVAAPRTGGFSLEERIEDTLREGLERSVLPTEDEELDLSSVPF